MYGRRSSRADLIGFAWSAPMRTLAANVGMTDVGLKKLLSKYGVPFPPQGYWNKVHAGRKVPNPPRPAERGPGETLWICIDQRLKQIPEMLLPPQEGPFASGKVPECLDALRDQVSKTIGRPASASTLSRPHASIVELFRRDEKARQKETANPLYFFGPYPRFESPYEKRRLRIFNAILMTLERVGFSGSVSVNDEHARGGVIIGDTWVEFDVFEKGKPPAANRYHSERTRPDASSSGAVTFELIATASYREKPAGWSDTSELKIEQKIGAICTELVVIAEASYRASVAALHLEVIRQAEYEERRRREREEEWRKQRLEDLHKCGDLLAKAKRLRDLIATVADAMAAGGLDVSSSDFAEWKKWADAEADRIDPVKTGQILKNTIKRS